MFRIFWFELERCFILLDKSGLPPWEETWDPERKALVSYLVWYPMNWGVRERGDNLEFLRH